VDALLDFLLRLVAGMAAAMALVPARQVSSAFFRNHLYIVLGVSTLACLAGAALDHGVLWPPIAMAVLAYTGSVLWLYEARRPGRLVLCVLCGLGLYGSFRASPAVLSDVARAANVGTSSWLLGSVMVSMLLGHWYLNAPEMETAPLRRLLTFASAGLVARAGFCAAVLGWKAGDADIGQAVLWLLVLRWLFGLVGLAGVLWMAWQTLKIPNTQSATGLLYVAVIAVLGGELVSLLLSAQHGFAV
jgi:hypothetical protein